MTALLNGTFRRAGKEWEAGDNDFFAKLQPTLMKLKNSTALLLSLATTLMVGCIGGGASSPPTREAVGPVSVPVSDARLIEIEDQIVSTFENSTTVIQYGSIVYINDGRGYTAGRAGFTSGTGDLLHVVEAYTVLVPNNGLAKFIPELKRVNGTASVVGLSGLVAAWQLATKDTQFIAVQDRVNDRLYRQPARQLAAKLGGVLPLTKLALYETGIQHGIGIDADSVNAISQRATKAVGGTPRSGVDEKKWLQAFLAERRKNLLNSTNKATAASWAASVSRADAIQSIFDKGNYNLDKTIVYTVYGDRFTI